MKTAAPTCLVIFLLALFCNFAAGKDLPTNNNPNRQIRFRTPAEAEARREKLINFIWSEGLPETLPHVTRGIAYPDGLTDIDPSVVARVDELSIEVSGYNFFTKSYLLHPRCGRNANRLVIIQQGHGDHLDISLGRTADHLLRHGFTVALMHMPLLGWNTDNKGTIPAGATFEFSARGTTGHNEIFDELSDTLGGATFRFFLEPIVQCVNHFIACNPCAVDVSMIGLSGGGWTTSMAAAIDRRIRLSVPVAGSAPLYVRNADPRSVGDAEQFYAPLYNENIAADGSGGGVATWLEIYALGAYGPCRRQVMVTNEFDTCCFSGHFADSFKQIVADTVQNDLCQGKWSHVLDSTHKSHIISPFTIQTVIDPLLGITAAQADSRTGTGVPPSCRKWGKRHCLFGKYPRRARGCRK